MMPFTKKGKKVKAAFKKEYGTKKGEDYFYGYENKNRNNEKGKSLVKSYPSRGKMSMKANRGSM